MATDHDLRSASSDNEGQSTRSVPDNLRLCSPPRRGFLISVVRSFLIFSLPFFQFCYLYFSVTLAGRDANESLRERFWMWLLLSSIAFSFERTFRRRGVSGAMSLTCCPRSFLSVLLCLFAVQCLYGYIQPQRTIFPSLSTVAPLSASLVGKTAAQLATLRRKALRIPTPSFTPMISLFNGTDVEVSNASVWRQEQDIDVQNSNGDHVFAQDVDFASNPHVQKSHILSIQNNKSFSLDELIAAHQERCSYGVISVIFIAYNEHIYMARTLESLVRTTEPGLLRDIVIVDDFSTPELTTSYDTTLFSAPLVTVVRHSSRQGLIRSRVRGAAESKGSILVFFDAHVKPDPGWTRPILTHINANPRRVVLPRIPVLNETSWETNRNAVGKSMIFDWGFRFYWIQIQGNKVPVMSGGLFAISRKWWDESGQLDTGMQIWGGENIEQSIRMWLCGGEIVVDSKCVVAHVFRQSFPYAVNATLVLLNKLRVAEVWLDEYKRYFYEKLTPRDTLSWKPSVPLPFIGEGDSVHPSVEAMEPFKGISQRIRLREQLQCKPFRTYIDRFHDAFVEEKLLAVNTFHIRNEKYQSCLTNVESSQRVELQPCDPNRRNQQWFFRYNQTGIQNLASDLCLDGVLGEVPTTLAADTTMIAEYFSAGKSFPFIAYPCSSESPSQTGWRFFDHRLFFGSFCVEATPENTKPLTATPIQNVVMTVCKHEHSRAEQDAQVVPKQQMIQLIFHRVVQLSTSTKMP